ncbi:Lsr2 dimerization domain-containing protein [Nonomuraea sp. KM90]|uniref:Lsr2 dimerization domain-containing protein n=1 Tax=Nonomuraea sp. KM90 TaxID=3457428 RepID=UPI003FCC4880
MAKQVREILIDDVVGGPAKETVNFGIDSAAYEIDLNDANATTPKPGFRSSCRHW